MSGGYGYDDRAIYSRGGNGYTDNRLALHDAAEDSFRHTASGGVCHHSGSVTPGGDMHHSYGCCRESAWMHGIGQRETDSPMTKDYVRRSVIANVKTKFSRDLMPTKPFRNHRKVDLVNRGINSRSQWSEIHPKVRSDGSYPKDFLLPKTIEDFKNMDSIFPSSLAVISCY